MPILYKACPCCKNKTELSAAKCEYCGHTFRTKFEEPVLEPTRLVSDPVSVAATQAPSLWQQVGISESVFVEYCRQYTWLSSLQVWGLIAFLGIVSSPFGMLIFLYACLQKLSMRRRIAELGGNVDLFEASANTAFAQQIRPFLKAVLLVGMLFIGFMLIWITLYALLPGAGNILRPPTPWLNG